MNLDTIKNRLYRVVAVIGCSLLPLGCAEDEEATSVPTDAQDVTLQLNVGVQADNAGTTAPNDDERKIHTLRVYAFADIPNDPKDGRLVGHYYTDKVNQDPYSFTMPITFYQKDQQNVNFYVVANEGAMSTPGANADFIFSEKTTEKALLDYDFTQINSPLKDKGLPMYHQSSVVDLKKEGNSSVGPFNLQRPMGKLEVFAAKPEGETTELKITRLTLLKEGTRARNYLMPADKAKLEGITSVANDKVILDNPNGVVVAKQLGANADRKNPKPQDYTLLHDNPAYPFENPYGSTIWEAAGDEKGNVLKVDYTYGGAARSGTVYLPAIVRNHYYAVYCLIQNEGKISVTCKVLPWNHQIYEEITFDYPTYTNPIQPFLLEPNFPENRLYPQPEVSFTGTDNWVGSYAFKFSMTGPTGQYWKPTLDDHTGNFEVKVWQNGQPIQEDPKGYPVSANEYVIKVRALKSENVGKEVNLGISYTPTWTQEASLLLINGLTDRYRWEGSTIAEYVKIKQVNPK